MITNGIPIIYSPIQINFASINVPIPQADATMTPISFDAVDFAYRLSRLSTFLPAAQELLSVLLEFHHIITTTKVCVFSFLSPFKQVLLK